MKLILLLFLLWIYFSPTMVMVGRSRSWVGILFFVFNLLTAWTVIGWFLCLAIALSTRDNRPRKIIIVHSRPRL